MKTNPKCRVCGVELTEENWFLSNQKKNCHSCKGCDRKRLYAWRKANPDKAKAQGTRANRKHGRHPFNENKECALYLGVHIAEQALSLAFKDVVKMPYGNPGYDFICNHGKKIDVKSSCALKDTRWNSATSWAFHINHNTTADYFLCLAFDNREDLNPLHAWLLPGSKFNNFSKVQISLSTIHKWDAYALDISKISDCCDAMR